MTQLILIAEDDPHIRDVIDFALCDAGYETVLTEDGKAALNGVRERRPDMAILDVSMPEMDGLDVCRELRKFSDMPVLFLSARDQEVDRILGLELGGDDYVTKPFSPRELVARVKVILKRGRQSETAETGSVNFGDLYLDSDQRICTFQRNAIDLTGTEFNILHVLIKRPGVVFTRAQLLELAWPDNLHVSDRTIDSHVRNLRAKLKQAGCEEAIRTVHALGFQLNIALGKSS